MVSRLKEGNHLIILNKNRKEKDFLLGVFAVLHTTVSVDTLYRLWGFVRGVEGKLDTVVGWGYFREVGIWWVVMTG